MAVREIVRQGDSALQGNVDKIDKIDDEVLELIDDLIDTMRESETPGVGLAAPQIGVPRAVIVAEPPPDHEGTEAIYRGAVALVNPEVVVASGAPVVIEEGCLSCPGVTAEIERPGNVIVKGLDREGNAVKLEVFGALARIFQHEIDHLNGRFFFDHLNPFRRQLVKARIRRT
ncbi:MAG: peptide deformylase [Candidatus Eisenbacteria bacterium]|nr:peptide deformylase [Candidatus Eisenbacteria bacterium]